MITHIEIINHKIIDDDKFLITMKGSNVKYDFHRKQSLVDCEKYIIRWLDYNNFDSKKVLLLTGLICLNIAPLHHYPDSNLLYFLGVKMVDDHINN